MKLYFAYGSNLWLEQMQRRCPDHELVGPGFLMGYRVIITSRGYASVVRSEPDLVLGIIYAISAADEERLDLCEGVPDALYRKELLRIETECGGSDCLVYVDPVQEEGVPREEYVERLRRGIRDAGLPEGYVERYLWQLQAGSEAA